MLQTPAGFLVDRIGARVNLIAGLLLGAAAVAVAALADSFWVFVAMFAVLGLANTVYHPADYALLSERVAPARVTQVFLLSTPSPAWSASAIAPVTLLFMQTWSAGAAPSWAPATLGVVAALFLALQSEPPLQRAAPAKARGADAARKPADGWRLLLSPPILLNLAFFVMLSMVGGGLNQYLGRRARRAAWDAAGARQLPR